MYVYLCLQRPEEGVRGPGAGVTGCEFLDVDAWEPDAGPSQSGTHPLTAEPSF